MNYGIIKTTKYALVRGIFFCRGEAVLVSNELAEK